MKIHSVTRPLGLAAILAFSSLLSGPTIAQAPGPEAQAVEESASPPPGFEQIRGPGSGHEEVAASPLVIAAYGLIWALLIAYLGLLWRRQRRIKAELEAVWAELRAR